MLLLLLWRHLAWILCLGLVVLGLWGWLIVGLLCLCLWGGRLIALLIWLVGLLLISGLLVLVALRRLIVGRLVLIVLVGWLLLIEHRGRTKETCTDHPCYE